MLNKLLLLYSPDLKEFWGSLFSRAVQKHLDGTLRVQENPPEIKHFRCPPCLVVPRLELDARWKYPGGGGHRRLPGHLHLCALQRPGYHGHVPPCHFGAKGTLLLFFSLSFSFCVFLLISLCVFVKDPPYFNVRPGGEYRQEAGRELVIPCAASGDPDIPTITWRKVSYKNTHRNKSPEIKSYVTLSVFKFDYLCLPDCLTVSL